MSDYTYGLFGCGLTEADYRRLVDEGYYQVGFYGVEGLCVLEVFDPEAIEAHPKTSPAIEKYQLTALDMQSEILDFWNFTRWQKLRNRLKRRHWIWDHKGLRMRPALEAAAAADRLAKALEAHDPEIEPLYDRIRIYDDTPPENYGQSPDDFQTQRDNFVWMFREIKRTCEALAGRGADMVTFVRINE